MLTATTTDTRLHLTLSDAVTLADAEGVVRAFSVASGPVTLDLAGIRFIDIGAGTLIGNSLRPHAQQNWLRVAVPSSRSFSKMWFKLFTRSGLGVALGTHVTDIVANSDNVTDAIREYYGTRIEKRAANFIHIGDLHKGTGVNVDNAEEFIFRMYKRLSAVRLPRLLFTPQDRMRAILKLSFEAGQNVLDHAGKRPLDPQTPILSYLSIRRYRTISAPREPVTPLRRYLERLYAITQASDYPGFIEIVVNDDGAGIAARQALSFDVYQGDAEREDEALRAAFRAGSSIKLVAKDSTVRAAPGFGLSTIEDNVRMLRAFAAIRTGRRQITLDGAVREAVGFAIQPDVLGCLPGTYLQVIVPYVPQTGTPEQTEMFG